MEDLIEEIWFPINEFSRYSISSYGYVRNEDSGRIIQQSTTVQGAAKVGLVFGNKQYTRSVKVLVAQAFVPGRTDRFDTPMHLDGNQLNNRVDNIVWRPRWFVWKYKRQFESIERFKGVGPLRDRSSGKVYSDIFEAALVNGLLAYEVEASVYNNVPVWPTWHMFEWA